MEGRIENGIIWKTVEGFEDHEVSEEGKLVSNKRNVSIPLKLRYTGANEDTVSVYFCIGRSSFIRQVAYIVAKAFIENPNNFKYIKFKDKNRSNCHRNNLEWTDNPYDSDKIWEPLKEFSKYEICPTGIRHAETKKELKITQPDSEKGYPSIGLYNDDGIACRLYIHILMAKQYIPNPNNLPEVNHLNGIKDDFRIENLEWTTSSGNALHASEMGLLGRYKDQNVKTEFSQEDLEREIWKKINTKNNELNKKYDVSNIGRVRSSKTLQLLSPSSDKDGYSTVNLLGTTQRVCRLVAYAFLDFEEYERSYQVNHKNKIKNDDRVENLQILDPTEHGTVDQGKPILALTPNNTYLVFRSQSEASRLLNINRGAINAAVARGGLSGKPIKYRWYHLDSEQAKDIMGKFPQGVVPTSKENIRKNGEKLLASAKTIKISSINIK